MAHRLNTNKQFMIGNFILAFAVIFIVTIFVFLSLNMYQNKKENRTFVETYYITLGKSFSGSPVDVYINDSLCFSNTVKEAPLELKIGRFNKHSTLMIVNKTTDKLFSFNLKKEGGSYFFKKEENIILLEKEK